MKSKHYEAASCRQPKSKKEKVDLDLIERILDVSEEDGTEKVHVKFRGEARALLARLLQQLSQTLTQSLSVISRLS